MITLTPGQSLVISIVFVGFAIVIMWGLIAGARDRRETAHEHDSRRRLRRELDRQGPPRWHR